MGLADEEGPAEFRRAIQRLLEMPESRTPPIRPGSSDAGGVDRRQGQPPLSRTREPVASLREGIVLEDDLPSAAIPTQRDEIAGEKV
jgi:hypothetical protein